MSSQQSDGELILHTGNLLRIPTATFQDEYHKGIKKALKNKIWKQIIPDKSLIANDSKISTDDKNIKLNTKLFLSIEAKPEHVQQAVYRTLADLSISYIDQVLLRVVPGHQDFKSLWKALEHVKESGLVKEIGVCNLNVQELKDLLSYAKIRPVANQIRVLGKLDTNLVELCEKEGIKLVAGAPTEVDVLDSKTRAMLQKHLNVSPSVKSAWVVQYTVVKTWSGVVTNRGYIIQLRDV